MAYVQVDGNKDILVNEKGQVREGLRNLPEDSDRFEYEYDSEGNKQDEWPYVVVDIDSDGNEDKRLLPEIVMKTHGEIPRNVKCSRSDFKAKEGHKANPLTSGLDNIEYVGDASTKSEKGKPYTQPPQQEQADAGEAEPAESTEVVQGGEEAPTPEDQPENLSDLGKGSAELSAKRAIEIIEKYELEELQDLGFFTEDSPGHKARVTVVAAWKKKKKNANQ